MLRTRILSCRLPKIDADALNQESGRIYTQTLVWHYRVYRRTEHWLSPYAGQRFGDCIGDKTNLTAHSKDAAQEGFYRACKTAKANRGIGSKYPHKRKFWRTTVWRNSCIRKKDSRLLLSRAHGLPPVVVSLPAAFASLPSQLFRAARLVYDRAARKYRWHLVIEDGILPSPPPGDKTLAIDLGEVHPMAVANEKGEVVIFSARALRAVNQYRNKKLSSLQRAQAAKVKGSSRWRKLQRRKVKFLARNKRQRRDIEHKVTRAVANYAIAQKASRVVAGDIRDIADGKRLNTKSQQKISNWSHGKQIQFLTYKLAMESIGLDKQDEAYSTKTCPKCGALNKPKGRIYRCSKCGFVAPRDSVGSCNQESKVLFGKFGCVLPISTKYLHPFEKRCSSSGMWHPASSSVAFRQR